ncbi:hypothetical protein [Bacillus cereus group sp. BfR-BA-01331]|uniref:hypothetical protein n=1 Tax=Bacillus cereus group sp. BfR-BA-01331 TaxID=2920307 RepID=UPI001F5821CF|nr:hypothetical protein [Bacillus cereus group sp. BfR-BA-01331]
MKYYNAGFLIISYENDLINKNCIIEGLPETILTISNEVRPTFPDYWFFPWCNTDENDSSSNIIKSRLKISRDEHEKAQSFLNTLIQEKKFSWPNVFKSLEDARFFQQNYLKGIENLEIISLNLSDEYRTDFLLNELEGNNFEVSIYDFLEGSLPVSVKNHKILGFDICGYDNNSFYSFILNRLHEDFDRFDKKLNALSLIENYDDAKEIIHLIDEKKIEAEEVLWYPWLILKCK